MTHPALQIKKLTIVLINPSRYDDDGYVIRYLRGVLPCNTLACMHSLTLEFAHADRTEEPEDTGLWEVRNLDFLAK